MINDPVYHHEWYLKNRDRRLKQQSVRKAENVARIRAIKAIAPCADCKKRFDPVCMDFDHTEDNKIGNVSSLLNYRWEKIQEEINKCEIVCSNCHRIRTHRRHTQVARD